MLQSHYQKSVEEIKRSLSVGDFLSSRIPACLISFGLAFFFLAERLTLSDAIDLICTIIREESGLNIDCNIF